MKRLITVIVLVTLLFTGCAKQGSQAEFERYSYEIQGTFDTLIQLLIYAENEKQAQGYAQIAEERLRTLHQLYDKYNEYPGLNNIKTINDNAGLMPVETEEEIIDLLLFAKEWYDKTGGQVNIALGSVLNIWHNYRQHGLLNPGNAQLPSYEELQEAAIYTDLNKVIVNEENKTVFLQEKEMSLDVGAVAKGYATEVTARELEEQGVTSMIISSGGNVRLIGQPLAKNKNRWGVAIQNPDKDPLSPEYKPLDIAFTRDTSLVTSGDYQRFYKVEDKAIHHIINPRTLMPADHYRAVTVMIEDSGVADFMSTTLFILPFEESQAMASQIPTLEVLWVFPDGSVKATDGMKQVLKNLGGATALQ